MKILDINADISTTVSLLGMLGSLGDSLQTEECRLEQSQFVNKSHRYKSIGMNQILLECRQ